MNKDQLLDILNQVASGELSPNNALNNIKTQPFEDLGFANIDLNRGIRQGMAEVIYGSGKTVEQIDTIVDKMLKNGEQTVLITRLDKEKADIICSKYNCKYDEISSVCVVGENQKNTGKGKIVVACAGTSDLYCAQEAALTAEAFGNTVVRLYDVGVAGIHRVMAHIDDIMSARAIVAVAGMEGALASVIGGLADCPVIAVPTSVGYGANFGGVSALLSMLNSCASTVSVVNIDNGFSAGYIASVINHLD